MDADRPTEEYKITHILKGCKPLCFVGEKLLVFRKGKLYLLDLDSMNKTMVARVPRPFWHGLLGQFRLPTRLLRLEPRAAVYSNGTVYFGYQGFMLELKLQSAKIEIAHQFRDRMQAPLVIAHITDIPGFDDIVCYGEYFGNPSMESVSIVGKRGDSKDWVEMYRFEKGQINHIHSIVPDSYNDRVWVLTGDTDEASAIWYSDDNFQTLNRFLGGKQKYRCCSVFPTRGGIVYATDTPLRENHIYSVNLADKSITKIADLNGSCIYSSAINDDILISTTVEGTTSNSRVLNWLVRQKGPGIKSWYSELLIGNGTDGFRQIAAFEKDYFPTAIFQFGTLVFAHGDNETGRIVFYGNSVKGIDGKLVVMEVVKS